jgi:curli production assembly/transport component CsgG
MMKNTMAHRIFLRALAPLALSALLGACAAFNTDPISTFSSAQLAPTTSFTRDLADLPLPKGRIVTAVYGFKDQTGQNKTSPDIYSTAVTQGGASILVKALRDSRWFIPVERENFNDIITERKLIRQTSEQANGEGRAVNLPAMTGAGLIIEGSIIGYDSNIKTGGVGAKYLGISLSNQYRADQVSVNLRAVDVNTGQILHTVSTTKTVYSVQLTGGIYKFVNYKSLLEAEVGTTLNEPAQIAVQEAIESAVVNLIIEGIDAHSWSLANADELHAPILERYREQRLHRLDGAPGLQDPEAQKLAAGESDADSAFARNEVPVSVLPGSAASSAASKKKKRKAAADTPAAVVRPAFGFDEQ